MMKFFLLLLIPIVFCACPSSNGLKEPFSSNYTSNDQPFKIHPKNNPSPVPSPTSEPSSTPSSNPIVLYDPFAAQSMKTIFIVDETGWNPSASVHLALKSLYEYGMIQSTYFVYFKENPIDGSFTIKYGCQTKQIYIEDSETNFHRLVIEMVSQYMNPTFLYESRFLVKLGPVSWDGWNYDDDTECKELSGEWLIDIRPYHYTYHTMTKIK